MSQDTKRDYTGKIVFIGIDVHKKTYSCAALCDNSIIKRDTLPACPDGLVTYIHNTFPEATVKTAYEAGFLGFYLHRYLLKNKIDNIVVHPASIEVSCRDRVKTDKRDALKIVTQLAAGRLRGIYVPCSKQEARRSISRLRANTMTSRTRVALRLKSLLFTQNLIQNDDDTTITLKWINQKYGEVKKLNTPDFMYTVEHYIAQWKTLTEELKQIQNKLQQQSKSDATLHALYESAPGIGLIHGRELANELGDMNQFKSAKQVFSFTGLTPSQYSSGEHIRYGSISRQGRSVLRKILIEAAWVAITKDKHLYDVYEQLSKRRGKRRAIIGVARRLIGRIRACIISNTRYTIKPFPTNE
jgi:transposase